MKSSNHDRGTDILFFVEDPGAANYLGELPEYLSALNISFRIIATGTAGQLLKNRGIAVESVGQNDDCQRLLDLYEPGLIAVGTAQNPDTMGLSLVDAGKRTGVPTVGMVDMAVDAALRFCGRSEDPLCHVPDWLIVPDAVTRDAFCALGFSESRIRICGNPNYDRILRIADKLQKEDIIDIRKRVFPPGLPAGSPVVIFVSEHVDGSSYERMHRNVDYTLHGHGKNDSRTIIVLEEVLAALQTLEPLPYTTVRLHPKNTIGEFAGLEDAVDFFSIGGDPLELIWCADLVVGMTSMLMMEAVVMGKKTLSVLPRAAEASWTPNTMSGLTPVVTTRSALREKIHDLLLTGEVGENRDQQFELVRGADRKTASFFSELLGRKAGH